MTFKVKLPHLLTGAMASVLLSGAAFAQDTYPDRAITLVVPFAAGGGTDSIAREVAADMQRTLGQPVVVENVGGGGGSIGANRVAKSDADGYTLLFVTSTFVTHSAVDTQVPYDVNADFTPIAQLGRGPLLVVVAKDVQATNIPELVTLAKDDPDALAFASAGPGSINHLSGELFNQRAGTDILHIPYQGSGPATFDLVSGAVQLFFATIPTMKGQVDAGEVKLIATTGAERATVFPDVPTVQEQGIEGFDVETWWGIVGPADLPEDLVTTLNTAVNDAVSSEMVTARLTSEGATVVSAGPEALGETITSELAEWKALVSDAGITTN